MGKNNYCANNRSISFKNKSAGLAVIVAVLSFMPFLTMAGKNETWIDCGLRGAFNSTWLINTNVINDKYLKYDFSFGYSAGGKIGLNFSEYIATGVEVLYSSYSQKYTGALTGLNFTKEINYQAIDVPVLFKYTNDFSYLEVGPQFSFLQHAQLKYNGTVDPALNATEDLINDLNLTNIGLSFGWGSILWATGGLSISTGLRLNYFFTDLLNEQGGKGQSYPYPLLAGYPATEAGKPYKSTHAASVGFMISLDYDLGYIVSSSCKRSRKFIFFGH